MHVWFNTPEDLHQLYLRDVSCISSNRKGVYGQAYVGYADKNSAKLSARHKLQTPDIIKPHNIADGPPEGSAIDKEAESDVQELSIANASPSIDLETVSPYSSRMP